MSIKSKFLSFIIITVMALSISMPYCFADTQNTLQPKTKVQKKSEVKSVFGRFLITMLWVCGSAAAIFLILLAYKRLKSSQIVTLKQIDIEKNLNSPETVDEVAKFVIEKF